MENQCLMNTTIRYSTWRNYLPMMDSGMMARASVTALTTQTCRQSICCLSVIMTSYKKCWMTSSHLEWPHWQRSMVLTRQTSCPQQNRGCPVQVIILALRLRPIAVNLHAVPSAAVASRRGSQQILLRTCLPGLTNWSTYWTKTCPLTAATRVCCCSSKTRLQCSNNNVCSR